MVFDLRKNAKKYKSSDGDTLERIAQRERDAGNDITWEDIAKFNWGSADKAIVNEYLRDALGARLRDADKNFLISADDEPSGELLIPIRYKKANIETNKKYVFHVTKQPAPPQQFLECASIPGVTFEFDKSFVRPSVVDHLAALQAALKKHPAAKVLVFGHTDKVGSETYNKALSERRANSVYAFITNDVNTWEQLYTAENWGIKSVQEVLADLGGPYHPGLVDGKSGPKTEAAIKNFQKDNGLVVDGVAGPNTRKKLFMAYMSGKHDIKLTADDFLDPKHIGCGEFNPVIQTEEANEANRRVMFYLFDAKRPPSFPCKEGDVCPCKKQMTPPKPRYVDTFACSFYDSVAKDCGCEIKPAAVKQFAVAFISPQHKVTPVKQYINLKSADAGRDALGHVIEFTVGAKTDPSLRPARDGDTVFIEVLFDRSTGRNDPKPKLDIPGAQELDGGKLYTGSVKFAGGASNVTFTVDLGLAGSEKCEVKIGSTAKCEDAKVNFENWRKVFFQLSLPQSATAPSFTRMTNALGEIFVEYEKYKDHVFETDKGPSGSSISWFPGEWLDEPGKKLLNLGDYNKDFFHKQFVDDKTPLGVHIAACHTQYDANSAACERDFLNVEASATSTVVWSDGSTANGVDIFVGDGLFPLFLKDGTDARKSASWSEKGGTGKGTIGNSDILIRTGALLGWLTIRLPAAAKLVVDSAAGKHVLINATVMSAQGPFLGESDGKSKWLQLVVIKQTANVVNDVSAHELGHTFNQVVSTVAPGMDSKKHTRKYTANGHQGPHCAFGMSEDNFAKGAGKKATPYEGNFAGKPECTCIMYGENGSGSTCTGTFCDLCKPFLKSEGLTTLHEKKS